MVRQRRRNLAPHRLVGGVTLLTSVVLGPLALGAEYFISPSGEDSASGARDQPWRTLSQANRALQPGDTLTLLDGQHAGVIEPVNTGREGAPITYRADHPGRAVVTGGQAGDDRETCVRMAKRDWIVLAGLRLEPRRGGWMSLEGAKHCLIRQCSMEHATGVYSPIECRDCHYNRYEDLECVGAIYLGEDGHVAGDMWNNFGCTHNVFLRIHISRAGHRPFGLWHDCPHNVVRQCVFDCRWGRNFEFFSTPRLLMEECVITNGFDGSGSADGRAKLFVIDSIFRRNVIYRNYYGPLVINSYRYEQEQPWGMMRSRLYHNTWYRNHEYGFEMVDDGDKPEPHMVAGNVFQNSIFACNDPGGDGLALLLTPSIAEDNLFRYNLLFGGRPGSKTVRYDWPSPGVKHWEGLTMTAEEANAQRPAQFVGNLDAEPQFVDPGADDYRLQRGSPGIDAGKPLATTRERGSGTEVLINDARWFYDGFGIPGEEGDLVLIGKRQVRVVHADIERNVLVVDRPLAWKQGEGVALPYVGGAPDLGAYEFGAERAPWYRAPKIPQGLRIATMETATEPVVVIGFEPQNLEEWFYYWNFARQYGTKAEIDDTTAASGRRSMRVSATGEGATLSCDIRPTWWDIDRFPIVRFSYRIPQGVPVGVWVHAFKSTETGQGAVCLGGSATRAVGGYVDLKRCELTDDDAWHTATVDVRAIREVFPQVKLLQMLRFATIGNGRQGQQYWFDDFAILPGQ